MEKLDLSVHQLVDFLLRRGDIDDRIFNRSSMQEGSKIHSFYQSKQGSNYISEYPLNINLVSNGVEIYLHGRADGVINSSGYYIIDEIKSTVIDLDKFYKSNEEWHLGQAKCYAFILLKNLNLSSIGVRLTYIKQGSKEKEIKNFSFMEEELSSFVYSLVDEYLSFYNIIFRHQKEKQDSINKLRFPYMLYRSGQKEMSKFVYSTITKKSNLFVEAPTGIGKTISVIFPALKALKDDEQSRLFYLTAKTSGKESAFSTFALLKKFGLKYYDIILTAKEKICFCKGKACNPDECPFTKLYYNKIGDALRYALLNFDSFSLLDIERLAKYFEICPFEFQLDLSLFMNCIICDYNYCYDPISYLKRYFDDDSSNDVFLIDEAHNLVERSRNMYSANLCESLFIEAKKNLKKVELRKLKNKINKIIRLFANVKSQLNNVKLTVEKFDDEIIAQLNLFLDYYQEISKDKNIKLDNSVKDLYLQINRFLKIYELTSEKFLLYYSLDIKELELKILCLDASSFIKNISKKVRSSIFFSATLSPINYYIKMLGGDTSKDPYLQLASPFNKNNFLPLVANKVSIKYKNRDATYKIVISYIKNFISAKTGNYFIFCPSYEYLDKLKDMLRSDNQIKVYIQNKDMSDAEKIEFLEKFEKSPKITTLGLMVIGSFFSEGIDLVDDRLIGAIIIGIGLSKINFETDKIKEYFDKDNINGFLFAYLYPAMNKVMQAIGRVIRGENDVGACLLIDERFLHSYYLELIKNKWSNFVKVSSPLEVKEKMDIFFNKKKDLL